MMRRLICVLMLFLTPICTPAAAQSAREVSYTAQSVVTLKAKLRFTTMIILPEQEEILDFVCGDKEFWIVSGAQNLAYVKPAKAGATTNLNLITATGHVYSFVLTESSGEPDLKVFVKPDETLSPTHPTPQKFFSSAQFEDLKREVDDARKDAEDARKQVDGLRESISKQVEARVAEFRAEFPVSLQFPYRFKPNQKPFYVSAIYTDGKFTYIRANASELPALYELVSNGPRHQKSGNLVNFQVEHGVYIVPKVLEGGYLVIGNQTLAFETVR